MVHISPGNVIQQRLTKAGEGGGRKASDRKEMKLKNISKANIWQDLIALCTKGKKEPKGSSGFLEAGKPKALCARPPHQYLDCQVYPGATTHRVGFFCLLCSWPYKPQGACCHCLRVGARKRMT